MNADVPEFEVNIDAQGRVKFAHPGQAHAYLRRFAGTLIAAQFYEFRTKRSDKQSRAFHAMVKPWLHCEARGGWTIEALKLWALGEVFGYVEFVRPTTGEVVRFPAEPHTSKLSMAQFAELIERTLEFAAEDGVLLTAPDEYRKAKEAAEKRAARKGLAA
jgi:hypothetical protein